MAADSQMSTQLKPSCEQAQKQNGGPWNRCSLDRKFAACSERHVRFARQYMPERRSTSPPREGCLLLGQQSVLWTRYASTFYVKDRDLQARLVAMETVRDQFTSFLYLPETHDTCLLVSWHALKSLPFLLVLWLCVAVLHAFKATRAAVHTFPIMLGLSVVEAAFITLFIALNVLPVSHKHHHLQKTRRRLEQVAEDEDIKESQGYVRTLIYSVLVVGLSSCIACVFLVAVLAAKNQLGWTIFTNQALAIFNFTLCRLTHAYLDQLNMRITLDQHRIAMYESLLHLGKLYWAHRPDQRRLTKDNIEFFVESLKGTEEFGRPAYIACPADSNRDVVTARETGV